MSERLDEAATVVLHHQRLAFGAGLVPVPLVDFLAVTGIQIRMLSKLSGIYEIPFAENRAKVIISSLLGAVVPTGIGGSVSSLLKAVPLVGQALGVLTMPVFAYAATHAVGRVFIQHFETGGTLLDFDAEATREHFRREFTKGKAEAEKEDKADKTAAGRNKTSSAAA